MGLSRRRETGRSLCPIPSPFPKPDLLLTPPFGPLALPSAPDRLRKGLVWAVRTGGPPAAATAAAAAAAAMRLVLLLSEGATRAPAGSRGGADAVGSRPGVPADNSGVELPASRLAMGSWEPPAICSRCSSRSWCRCSSCITCWCEDSISARLRSHASCRWEARPSRGCPHGPGSAPFPA